MSRGQCLFRRMRKQAADAKSLGGCLRVKYGPWVATIDHVGIRSSNLGASLRLYDRVMELLEFGGQRSEGDGFYEWDDFSVGEVDSEHLPTRNVHIGFAATSREQVDRWWRTLTAAGYADDGPPGPRPEYSLGYYGAFICDPAGNSIEAVQHEGTDQSTGIVDHVWIRVRSLDASRPFYSAIADALDLDLRDHGDRIRLRTDTGTFSLVQGKPTEHLRLALGVDGRETVAAFHEAGLRAGGIDNGAPGERPQYHPGYYAAFLLDPDGNNVEAVFHDRG